MSLETEVEFYQFSISALDTWGGGRGQRHARLFITMKSPGYLL
jgi:hypothetical protein